MASQQVDELQLENSRLKRENAALERRLADLERRLADLQRVNTSHERDLVAAREHVRQLGGQTEPLQPACELLPAPWPAVCCSASARPRCPRSLCSPAVAASCSCSCRPPFLPACCSVG